MPVAKSQDSPGAIGRTVYDVATALSVLAGSDSTDSATVGKPAPSDYTKSLTPGALQGKKIAVLASSTDVAYPGVVSSLQALGATTVVKTIGTPSPNPPSIVPTEFKRDLNAYLGSGHTGGAKSLADIVAYNFAHPAEGLKYQQGQLVAAQAIDLSDIASSTAYTANLVSGRVGAQAVIDTILNNGEFDAIVVPNSDPLIGYADRAGYPVLTVPAGYGLTASGAGHNPIGVAFVGTAFSEDKLLADGFAYEQGTKWRMAPSYTNPSMWRCVPGSTFFTDAWCNPGDRGKGAAAAMLGLKAG
jgi:Asp-tRNA(Asn)/Glu-tRNA(Gln) amidotransferase A subunit family amidase